MKRLSDVRVAAGIVVVWSVAVLILLASLGFFSTSFFHFGPSPEVTVFQQPIDSWARWSAIASYIVVNQCVSTYGLESITPWMLNQLQNRQVRRLAESRRASLAVVGCWYFYLWLGRVVSIQLLLSQIDFLLLILVVDVGLTLLISDQLYLAEKLLGVQRAEPLLPQ